MEQENRDESWVHEVGREKCMTNKYLKLLIRDMDGLGLKCSEAPVC